MSDPNDHQQNHRRGLEDARRGENNEPGDWDARDAYRAGQQAHANEVAGQRYAEGVFSGAEALGASGSGGSQFNPFQLIGAAWYLIYYGIGAIIIGSLIQMVVEAVTGPGLWEGLAAVVGFVGGLWLIGTAFARVTLFRKAYALAVGVGLPALMLVALLFGSYQSTPILQRLMAVAAVAVVLGGASWLTYRHIERREG
jgi:hypothetical protein